MTKLLGLLALVQLVLIALLYMKLSAMEERIDGAAASSLAGGTVAPSLAQDPTDEPEIDSRGLDGSELRRIVREELRAAGLHGPAAERHEPEPAGQPVYDEAEMQERQDRVLSDLEFLKRQDEVSQTELDLLLADIARLDPERRSQALKELNRAMNRGEIRGNL